MLRKKVVLFVLATTFISSSMLPAMSYTPQYNSKNSYSSPGANYGFDTNYNQGYQQPAQGAYMPPLQGRVVIVPAGTSLSVMPTRPISTEYTTVGDTVSLVLASPFYYNGTVIAPANSMVNGNVVICQRAGRTGKNAKLKINFTNITTPNGQRIPISGKLLTQDGTGLLTGGTTKDRVVKAAKDTAIGSAGGALSGLVFGAISGGNPGKGTAIGTGIGAGLGLGKAVIDKGKEVIIDNNNPVDVVIDQPVTVNPAVSY
jgi:hypothetical protein